MYCKGKKCSRKWHNIGRPSGRCFKAMQDGQYGLNRHDVFARINLHTCMTFILGTWCHHAYALEHVMYLINIGFSLHV